MPIAKDTLAGQPAKCGAVLGLPPHAIARVMVVPHIPAAWTCT